jgi:RimJ/RimL family protein N-acetyltransferase
VELRDGDVELRAWTLDDVPALVECCNDAEIQRWIHVMPQPYSEVDAQAFVRGEVAGIGEQQFAITKSGRVVGSIGLGVNERLRSGHIGYWCAAHARGRGLTTLALRLLCRHALEDLHLERLELITDPDNRASQRVAEKTGFRREGVLRSHLPDRSGDRRDSVMFSLLPGELT